MCGAYLGILYACFACMWLMREFPNIQGVSVTVYAGYSLLAAAAVALCMGAVSFGASLAFVVLALGGGGDCDANGDVEGFHLKGGSDDGASDGGANGDMEGLHQ